MSEFFLEILSEEVPARMQHNGASILETNFCAKLKEYGLQYDYSQSYSTPQRLIIVVDGLPDRQPDSVEEKRGPKVDAKREAVAGFLRSLGYDSVDHPDISRKTIKQNEYYVARRRVFGSETQVLLAQLVQESLVGMRWPKSMRWGMGSFRWVRPIESILCLFNGQPLSGSIEIKAASGAGIGEKLAFGETTRGHRFLAPKCFAPKSFCNYVQSLKAAFVEIDRDRRKERIEQDATALAKAKNLATRLDDSVLEENAGLVEWPVVLMGAFEKEFLRLPDEVLITSMKKHQKYFPLYTQAGELAPWFVMVSNIESKKGVKSVVEGNERVLRARLHDAKFFWDTDKGISLDTHSERLSGITFHAKLGSIEARVRRIAVLVSTIGRLMPEASDSVLKRAAALCKADLVTDMVGEFPELQGVMGKHYALIQGEDSSVAEAIGAHYAPLGLSMPCPTEPNAICLALADKIDVLVGMFAAGEKPTGSKDPFALRRAALGVIRIILENEVRIPLAEVVEASKDIYASGGIKCSTKLAADVVDFIMERLKVHLRESGFRHDIVAASLAVPDDTDLQRLYMRVSALRNFLSSPDGSRMLRVYSRAMNIVEIEEKKQKELYRGEVSAELFVEPAEINLFKLLGSIENEVHKALANEDFVNVMKNVADLGMAITTFFDEVTVNTDDDSVRRNRLCLLGRIGILLESIADFSVIEG